MSSKCFISCNILSFVSFVTKSVTIVNNSSGNKQPWYTVTATSSLSDNCVQTFTLVLESLCKLITVLTNASWKLLCLNTQWCFLELNQKLFPNLQSNVLFEYSSSNRKIVFASTAPFLCIKPNLLFKFTFVFKNFWSIFPLVSLYVRIALQPKIY